MRLFFTTAMWNYLCQLVLFFQVIFFSWYKHWTELICCFLNLPLSPSQKFLLLLLSFSTTKLSLIEVKIQEPQLVVGLWFLSSFTVWFWQFIIFHFANLFCATWGGMGNLKSFSSVHRHINRCRGLFFCWVLSPMSPFVCTDCLLVLEDRTDRSVTVCLLKKA